MIHVYKSLFNFECGVKSLHLRKNMGKLILEIMSLCLLSFCRNSLDSCIRVSLLTDLSIPLDLLTNCPFLEIHKIWKNYVVYRHIYHTKQCTFLMRAKPFQDILFFNNNTQDLNLCFFSFFTFFMSDIKKFKSSKALISNMSNYLPTKWLLKLQ